MTKTRGLLIGRFLSDTVIRTKHKGYQWRPLALILLNDFVFIARVVTNIETSVLYRVSN